MKGAQRGNLPRQRPDQGDALGHRTRDESVVRAVVQPPELDVRAVHADMLHDVIVTAPRGCGNPRLRPALDRPRAGATRGRSDCHSVAGGERPDVRRSNRWSRIGLSRADRRQQHDQK